MSETTNNNVDVLPFIEQLGPVPAVLRDYEDNTVTRDAAGLSVHLSFNRVISPTEVDEAGKYCVAAFNLLDFKNAVVAPAGQTQGYGATAIKLYVAHDDIPGTMRPAHKKYEYELDVMEKIDSIGHRWVALRTIRQAAVLA